MSFGINSGSSLRQEQWLRRLRLCLAADPAASNAASLRNVLENAGLGA